MADWVRYGNSVELDMSKGEDRYGATVYPARLCETVALDWLAEGSAGDELGFMDIFSATSLENSYVSPGSTVVKSAITGSIIRDSIIKHSIVRDSKVSEYSVVSLSTVIEGSWVTGDSLIDTSTLKSVSVRTLVADNAKIRGAGITVGEVRNTSLVWGGGVLKYVSVRNRLDFMAVENLLTSGYFKSALYRGLARDQSPVARVRMGCWDGTLDEFETMILSDQWVDANYKERSDSRGEMIALINLFKERVARW